VLADLEAELADPRRAPALLRDLLDHIADGRAKLYLTSQTLKLRAARPLLFERGTYLPLEARGSRAEHVCAFARQHNGQSAVAVVGRWFTHLSDEPLDWPQAPLAWGDTEITLPCGGRYEHVLAGEDIDVSPSAPAVRVERLFRSFPAALLVL
jgi:(1->4)-alpha-D-glucan 1-alpha-D-glucosylmutase